MRDYIFRGKRADNGEWVQGNNIITFAGEHGDDIYVAPSKEIVTIVQDCDTDNIEKIKGNFYKVIPNTVCQYTGVNDKYGHKIFENDILYFYLKMPFETFSGYSTVKWLNNTSNGTGFFIVDYRGISDALDISDSQHFEIIGNIFEGEVETPMNEVEDDKDSNL